VDPHGGALLERVAGGENRWLRSPASSFQLARLMAAAPVLRISTYSLLRLRRSSPGTAVEITPIERAS
jgi:hypothetical protein